MSDRSVISPFITVGPATLVTAGIINGVGAWVLTPPQFSQFNYFDVTVSLDSVNGGTLPQLSFAWVGPPTGSYKQGGYWQAGTSGATPTLANIGTFGGQGVLALQDQLNVACTRLLRATFCKFNKTISCEGTAYDDPSTNAFNAKINGRTLSGTDVTGLQMLSASGTATAVTFTGTYTVIGRNA